MSMLALTALGTLNTPTATDAEVAACLLTGKTRADCGMPGYCQSTGWNPASWFRGLLPQCAPYTPAELDTMTTGQMRQACTSPDGVVDENCVQSGIDAARASTGAAARTDPEGTCEYNAAVEWPSVSRVLGPALVCDLRAGKYNTWFILGGAAALFLLTRGRR